MKCSNTRLSALLELFFADREIGTAAAREIKVLAAGGNMGKVFAGGCEHLSLTLSGEVVAHGHRLSREYRDRAERLGIRII